MTKPRSEMRMAETIVRQYVRDDSGRLVPVRSHRRMLPMEELPEDAEYGEYSVKKGGLGSDLFERARDTGKAARGPWEVDYMGGVYTLFHYAFPIGIYDLRRGKFAVQGREGFGLSVTDMRGIREMVFDVVSPEHLPKVEKYLEGKAQQTKFTPYVYNRMGNRTGVGYDSEGKLHPYNPRTGELEVRPAPMSRRSPYAIIGRDIGEMPEGKRAFPSRRGQTR